MRDVSLVRIVVAISRNSAPIPLRIYNVMSSTQMGVSMTVSSSTSLLIVLR